MLPEFESAATGITVKLEQAPYDNLVQKAVLDLTTKKGNYDVLSIPYEYLGSFAEQKYISPVDEYLKTPPVQLGTTSPRTTSCQTCGRRRVNGRTSALECRPTAR